jgi:hypothetical protein
MHFISGLRKRAEAFVMTVVGVTGEANRAKKPTANKMLEDELRARANPQNPRLTYYFR